MSSICIIVGIEYWVSYDGNEKNLHNWWLQLIIRNNKIRNNRLGDSVSLKLLLIKGSGEND